MILLPCAWCGPRDAAEFQHVGELVARPDPRTASQQQWRAYLYLRANRRGWTVETWYHRMGCRRYVQVERHTETNEVRPAGTSGAASAAEVTGAAGVTGAAESAVPPGATSPAGPAGSAG
jgi:heterotetrameric sarcosine oxidase delta subunit